MVIQGHMVWRFKSRHSKIASLLGKKSWKLNNFFQFCLLIEKNRASGGAKTRSYYSIILKPKIKVRSVIYLEQESMNTFCDRQKRKEGIAEIKKKKSRPWPKLFFLIKALKFKKNLAPCCPATFLKGLQEVYWRREALKKWWAMRPWSRPTSAPAESISARL